MSKFGFKSKYNKISVDYSNDSFLRVKTILELHTAHNPVHLIFLGLQWVLGPCLKNVGQTNKKI